MDYEVGLFIVLFSEGALAWLIHKLIGDGYAVGPLTDGPQQFDNTGCTINAFLKVGRDDSFDRVDLSDRIIEVLEERGFNSPFHLVLEDPDNCEWCFDCRPMQEIPSSPETTPLAKPTAWDHLSGD